MRLESRASLGHILESAREIQSVTAGKTLAEYEADRYLRAIVERFFITIGEALSRIARHDPNLFGDISEARSIVAFRNVLVHGYDVIDARWGGRERFRPCRVRTPRARGRSRVDTGSTDGTSMACCSRFGG